MNKRKYFLILDTETCGELESPLVYDCGAQIRDLSGNVYESGSWVIYDIYVKERELMKSAYYSKKLPDYEKDLAAGRRKMVKFYTMRTIIMEWFNKYNIEAICAYNTQFDVNALNNTQSYLTDGRYKYFFPYGTKFIDIWNMASSSFFQTAAYYNYAYENNFVSGVGNVRTNAEVAYGFITGQANFEESHTALEDVEIEAEIFLYCWKKTKPCDRVITNHPWRKPQKKWYYVEARKDGVI